MFPETTRKRIVQRCAVLIIIGFALILFSSLFTKAARLPVKTYTVADGLLRDNIAKIKQDSRGFLWFCTVEGVSRFDGYAFTNFTVADGLPDGNVNDFLETNSGDYLFATDKGLAKLNPAGLRGSPINPLFTSISPDNKPASSIQVLFQDGDGKIFVGTGGGLYLLNSQDKLELINLDGANAASVSVTAVVKDRRGALWIGTRDGNLFRLDADRKIARFTLVNEPSGEGIASLYADRDGNLWAGMRGFGRAGLFLLDPQAETETSIVRRAFTGAEGLPSHWISAIYQTDDGQMWLGTAGGLCEWQGADAKLVCRTYTKENDLCDKDVWSVIEDKDGNLWTGSRCGVKKLARYGFTSYGEPDGIESVGINSVFENKNGELFATIIDKGTHLIYRFDGDGKFTEALPNLPGIKNYVGWGWKQTVRQDSAGAWLISTGRGLFKFAPEIRFENLVRAVPQIFSPITISKEIFRVFEDSRGDVWLATWSENNGDEIWRWERAANRWQDYTAQLLIAPNHPVSSFVEDQSGNLWIGTGADEGGAELIRYRDGQFKIFTAADGLPDGWIRDLYVDDKNGLWLANNKHGVLRLDDVNAEKPDFVRYSNADGLSSAGAYCVTEDAFGRIYVGSARGVDRLTPATGQIENFTTADGLPSSFVEEAYRDKNNNLWFGTHAGLTKFVPEPERKRQPPTVLITGLRVNGEPQPVSILGETQIPKLELNSEQRQVSLDFTGLGASLGEKVKYEYRLGNADWTQTNERTVNFANLAAGAYQFELRAVTADRLISNAATFSFKIASPFYLRPWFLLAAFLIFGGSIFSLYRYRVSRLLEMERMRTRIATDLHDDIGANLTKISILSEVAQQRLENNLRDFDDADLLENIAETSRESVSSMSDIVWAINPKKDSLADLTRRMRRYAEDLLERREINLIFNSPPDAPDLKLDANLRRNIYLVFKESLTNIVRHAQAENVGIDFHLENGKLLLKIADDGLGFEISDESDGNGLANMRKRAAELGANLEIISSRTKGATVILVLSPAFRRL